MIFVSDQAESDDSDHFYSDIPDEQFQSRGPYLSSIAPTASSIQEGEEVADEGLSIQEGEEMADQGLTAEDRIQACAVTDTSFITVSTAAVTASSTMYGNFAATCDTDTQSAISTSAEQHRHYLNVAPKVPKAKVNGAPPSVKKNERHYLNVAPSVPNKQKALVRVSPRSNKGKPAKKFGYDD